MRTRTIVSVAIALSFLACHSTTGPSSIPIRFQSTTGEGPVPELSVEGGSGSIRVVGGFVGFGCGPVGAFAELRGSVIRLTVGRRPENSACDAILVTYHYTGVLDVPPGEYVVEVFHRPSRDQALESGGEAVVTVR